MSTKKVLIVDDSPVQLDSMSEIVSSAGHQVITADSGRDAVDLALAELPDIIFMDIIMDDLDGYGACRQISENETTAQTPVILVSANNNRTDLLWSKRQGAKGLIKKPADAAQVIDEINKCGAM